MKRVTFEGKEQGLLIDYEEKPVAKAVKKL